MDNTIKIVVDGNHFKRETEKAVLVSVFLYDHGYIRKDVWFPKSQVRSFSVEREQDENYITVSSWIYSQKVQELGFEISHL